MNRKSCWTKNKSGIPASRRVSHQVSRRFAKQDCTTDRGSDKAETIDRIYTITSVRGFLDLSMNHHSLDMGKVKEQSKFLPLTKLGTSSLGL